MDLDMTREDFLIYMSRLDMLFKEMDAAPSVIDRLRYRSGVGTGAVDVKDTRKARAIVDKQTA